MNIYSKSIALALIALSMGFASCSDDDNDEPGNGPSTEVAVKPAEVFPQGLPTQIGDMQIKTNEKGLISEIKDGDKTVTFQYASASRATAKDYDVMMEVKWGQTPDEWVKFYMKLNKQGFVESALEQIYDEGDQDEETWAFEYNSDGQISKMTRSEGNNEVTVITYADGDIVNVDMTSDPDPENPEDRDELHAVITNTTIINKSGIMLFDDTYRIDMDEMAPAYFAGLLGKGTKHLPLEAVEGPHYSVTCKWTIDNNGMPSSLVTTTNEDGYEYTDEPLAFKWEYHISK